MLHSDIQNMAYLKAKLKHAVSGEDISCGWFFIILAEKHNFRIANHYFKFQFFGCHSNSNPAVLPVYGIFTSSLNSSMNN